MSLPEGLNRLIWLAHSVAKPSWAVVESSVDSRSKSQWDPPIVHTAAPEMTEVSLKSRRRASSAQWDCATSAVATRDFLFFLGAMYSIWMVIGLVLHTEQRMLAKHGGGGVG